jgi:multisubunit Na+/H+ antiporter MnhG subunit
MNLVFNEQIKLLAITLNTAATSCFTVGIATPVAGYIYNFGNMQTTVSLWSLGLGVAGWLLAAILLHFLARRALKGLKP